MTTSAVSATVEPLLPKIREAQRSEITEYEIYRRLARRAKLVENREILDKIGRDEKRHHDFWAGLTGRSVGPRRWQVVVYSLMARVFGLMFTLKLLERGEGEAQDEYRSMLHIEGVEEILHDEEDHERRLVDMLHDERLVYASSIILGLNDALVELTGALAGLSLALANTRVVAAAGLVTGIAAALSMGASEYLASRSEKDVRETDKHPVRAALYTGSAYVVAVVALILPFFLLSHVLEALACTLAIAVTIIAGFNFYISVARGLRFWPRFLEMAGLSLGVAAVSFGIGWLVRSVWGLEL